VNAYCSSHRSTAVNVSGEEIARSRERFSFSLPVAGHMCKKEHPSYPQQFDHMRNEVLGSPIFNFVGKLVGFVDRCGFSFDFKYGLRVEELDVVINAWLAGREWTVRNNNS
jgi:hypothetical protein